MDSIYKNRKELTRTSETSRAREALVRRTKASLRTNRADTALIGISAWAREEDKEALCGPTSIRGVHFR